MKRPRCEKCGERIYQIRPPYRIRFITYSYYNWKAPLHCPNCGVELSSEKISQVYGYDDSIYLGVCFGSVILVIVILVILYFMS